MVFKKIGVWILKNLIVLLLVTIIFSSVTLSIPSFLNNVFGDIYYYSSQDAQEQAIGKLTETCSSFQNDGFVGMQDLCGDESIMEEMRENCATYRELEGTGIVIENKEEVLQSCLQIESGELEEQCADMGKMPLLPDFDRIGSICREYNEGSMDDRQFFHSVIGSIIGTDGESETGLIGRLRSIVKYMDSKKILFIIFILSLFALLYFLAGSLKEFYAEVFRISLSLGILITVPYLTMILYDNLVGIDTTSILLSILGLGIFDPTALISVIILMFLRTYNGAIITTGIVCLAAGIGGKVYLKLKRKKEKIHETNSDNMKRANKKIKIKKPLNKQKH